METKTVATALIIGQRIGRLTPTATQPVVCCGRRPAYLLVRALQRAMSPNAAPVKSSTNFNISKIQEDAICLSPPGRFLRERDVHTSISKPLSRDAEATVFLTATAAGEREGKKPSSGQRSPRLRLFYTLFSFVTRGVFIFSNEPMQRASPVARGGPRCFCCTSGS